eukprot:COSAG01_NODE_70289_length_259_cov_0.618750_2_plen_41_part_01
MQSSVAAADPAELGLLPAPHVRVAWYAARALVCVSNKPVTD